MLQRLIAAVLGVLGLLAIGLGVASATVWRADDVQVATATVEGTSLITTDPGVLELVGDPVTVTARTSDGSTVVLAIGRDTDVTGWVGTDPSVRVTGLADWDTLRTTAAEGAQASGTTSPTEAATGPAPTEAATGPAPTDAATQESATAAAEVPVEEAPVAEPAQADPSGSDMWVQSAAGEGSATLTWVDEPGRWSLLVAGLGDASPTLELAWPRTVTTPWVWPGVVVGSLLLALALALAVRLWLRARRGLVGPEWHPVTTGMIPAVAPAAGTDVSAAGAGAPGAPLVLTRRQLREAQAADVAPGRRRDRGGVSTGAIPAVTPDSSSAPAPLARSTPEPQPSPSAWTPRTGSSASETTSARTAALDAARTAPGASAQPSRAASSAQPSRAASSAQPSRPASSAGSGRPSASVPPGSPARPASSVASASGAGAPRAGSVPPPVSSAIPGRLGAVSRPDAPAGPSSGRVPSWTHRAAAPEPPAPASSSAAPAVGSAPRPGLPGAAPSGPPRAGAASPGAAGPSAPPSSAPPSSARLTGAAPVRAARTAEPGAGGPVAAHPGAPDAAAGARGRPGWTSRWPGVRPDRHEEELSPPPVPFVAPVPLDEPGASVPGQVEAPAARADAWRRAWGFPHDGATPAPDEPEPHSEGTRR